MEFTKFVNKLEILTDEIETLIDENMELTGLTEEDCQALCVMNKLKVLQHAISGIEARDMQ